MTDRSPILYWCRRDFRLADNPALDAALGTGCPVIAVFILDEVVDALGAAPKWRLGLGLEHFARRLADIGGRLILRRGPADQVLAQLIDETGARAVYWGRQYDPAQIDRDRAVKSGLQERGILARSFAGHLLFEPWQVQTGQGRFYQVYSPFWRAVRDREIADALRAPARWTAPQQWPVSDRLEDWALGLGMKRGAAVVQAHLQIGEEAAQARLARFIAEKLRDYAQDRDRLDRDATSGLSENLTYGEISPHALWRAGQEALSRGVAGAETFLKEVVWREFAYHLLYHTPHIASRNWRDGWDSFPWRRDHPQLLRWKQGRSGITVIDAAMRELYVTGRMHNRARMLVGSYLTKHMMTHWQAGLDWFADCLVDWDPAANAMGWQWVAGCGPDAAPYFRVFNPDTQAQKFDPDNAYRARWVAELCRTPSPDALSFFKACPESWALSPDMAYPRTPIVDLAEGRKHALAAYENRATA